MTDGSTALSGPAGWPPAPPECATSRNAQRPPAFARIAGYGSASHLQTINSEASAGCRVEARRAKMGEAARNPGPSRLPGNYYRGSPVIVDGLQNVRPGATVRMVGAPR